MISSITISSSFFSSASISLHMNNSISFFISSNKLLASCFEFINSVTNFLRLCSLCFLITWVSPISPILPFNDSTAFWPHPISFRYYPTGKSTIQQGKKSRLKFFWVSPISPILPFNDSTAFWPYPISFRYYPIGKSTNQQGKKSRLKFFWVSPISPILPFNDSTAFWPYRISFRYYPIEKSRNQQGKKSMFKFVWVSQILRYCLIGVKNQGSTIFEFLRFLQFCHSTIQQYFDLTCIIHKLPIHKQRSPSLDFFVSHNFFTI